MGQISVLVVDDDRGTRRLVREVLSRDDAIIVVAEAGDGREAIERAATHQPDVIIMDIGLPVLDGHAATTEILALLPHTRVVMHSSSTEQSAVERAFRNGAHGYVTKANTYELRDAVRAVMEGRMFSSP